MQRDFRECETGREQGDRLIVHEAKAAEDRVTGSLDMMRIGLQINVLERLWWWWLVRAGFAGKPHKAE